MTFKVDGINGLTFADNSTQNVTALNAANITSGTLGKARLPTGSVLQVVRYEITSRTTFNSSGFTTAFSTSITPTSTNSKLLHMFWAKTDMANNNAQSAQDYQVTRNGTAVWGASWQNYFNRTSFAHDFYPPCDFVHWDEPGSTSSITYAFQGRIYAGGNAPWSIGDLNQNSQTGPRGNWIIMEIAG